MRELLGAKEQSNCGKYDGEIATGGFSLFEKLDSFGVETHNGKVTGFWGLQK